MPNWNRKACAYCGRQTDMSTDECENCGSTTFESLKDAYSHQEQHRRFNEERGYAPQNAYQNNNYKSKRMQASSQIRNAAVSIFVALIVLVGILFFTNSGPKQADYMLNTTVTTDWFKMTVHEGKIIRTKNMYCGIKVPDEDYERVLVDMTIYNHTNEDLDMNLEDDFYLEAGGVTFLAKNSGGSYSIYDKLSTDGMFFGKFMVSPNTEMHGYIAFDIPKSVPSAEFVYSEYKYKGDERIKPKKYYRFDLEYEMPYMPTDIVRDFYNKAFDAGYILEIINDYDGFDTFWIGAHKYVDDSSKGITRKPEPVYWIDLTRDISVGNAGIEFGRFVDKVVQIGGISESGGTKNTPYQYQINTSATKFGIAYRVGEYNYLVESAPIEYKTEIIEFLETLKNIGSLLNS